MLEVPEGPNQSQPDKCIKLKLFTGFITCKTMFQIKSVKHFTVTKFLCPAELQN